jgi:hypothetical protein
MHLHISHGIDSPQRRWLKNVAMNGFIHWRGNCDDVQGLAKRVSAAAAAAAAIMDYHCTTVDSQVHGASGSVSHRQLRKYIWICDLGIRGEQLTMMPHCNDGCASRKLDFPLETVRNEENASC